MTKAEVIAQINTPQDIVVAANTKQGSLEIYEYVEKPAYIGRANPDYWTSYFLTFVNGKLNGWERAEALNAEKARRRLAGDQIALQSIDALKGTPLLPTQQNINLNQNVSGSLLLHQQH
jgi:hypothetical protein